MSRIGNKPVAVLPGVEVEVRGNQVRMKGPKGELAKTFHPDVSIAVDKGQIVVRRRSNSQLHRSLHGLTRAILSNMVQGVSQGFKKDLEIEGVGYRAEMQGKKLLLWLGFSHPVEIIPPAGINILVDRGAKALSIEGADKELVGETAARIRAARPPEPYKGKGIHYVGERIKKKAGKAGKVGAAAAGG
ncbi:MAG: 50S ribosomal protein L6 [Chloroflexi bacterium]|nr:50S ribosomal protein L6 [Chloroflexota bacterium]